MRKWMILLAAVLMLLAGCGKEPAVAGLSNEEFHQSFAEDYAFLLYTSDAADE